MHRIALITYDISPYRGSEASVSWNFVSQMSQYIHLTVFYGRGNADIEKYLVNNPMPNVSFFHIEPKDALKYPKGIRQDYYDTIFYTQWHKKVYIEIQHLFKEGKIDLVHHLSPIGFKEPGYSWRIPNLPFVWGPIMAVENRPFQLYRVYSFKNKCLALARRIIHNAWFRYVPRIRKAFRAADVIFAVTPNGQRMIAHFHGRETTLMPENCIVKMTAEKPIQYHKDETLNIIWVGRVFDQSKGLEILLDALNKLQGKPWRLHVIGEGKLDAKKTQKLTAINPQINWYGKISRENVLEVFKQAHIHVITSLGEATTTVIWESMANAVPTMTLDHCGMSGVVCNKCGIKIPIEKYSRVVDNMANHINHIISNPSEIQRMSAGVIECSKNYMWNKRIEIFVETYNKLIAQSDRK